jgi:hypothetical protein
MNNWYGNNWDGMVVMAMASTIGTETIGVGMAVLDGTIGTDGGLEQLGLEWRFWME